MRGYIGGCWDGEPCPVASQVDVRILKESSMSLVVTPRTGISHEVGGEFPYDHLYFPRTGVTMGCDIGLFAVRGYHVGHY